MNYLKAQNIAKCQIIQDSDLQEYASFFQYIIYHMQHFLFPTNHQEIS